LYFNNANFSIANAHRSDVSEERRSVSFPKKAFLQNVTNKHLNSYMQFHPVAYLVKLNIEMSMATLIRKIASDQSDFQLPDTLSHLDDLTTSTNSHARQHSRSSHKPSMSIGGATHNGSMNIHTKKDFIVETRSIPDVDLESNVSARDLHAQRSNMGLSVGLDNDDRPLKPGDGTTWKMGNQSRVDTQV
jgi:hypothetical protein